MDFNLSVPVRKKTQYFSMAKAPADQFYYGDYIRDTRSLSLDAKGAWMDILCNGFFKNPQGRISQSYDDWARMFGCDVDTAKTVIAAIKKHQVGDVVTERNGDVTVTNRRMYNAWCDRQDVKQRVQRYRDRHGGDVKRKSNGKVTSLSSSSSSDLDDIDDRKTNVSIINLYLAYTKRFNEHDDSNWNGRWTRKDDAIGKNFNSIDLAYVELGIIQTQVNKGIGNGKIQSFQYYANEIQITAEKAGVSPESLQQILVHHRSTLDRWFGRPLIRDGHDATCPCAVCIRQRGMQ